MISPLIATTRRSTTASYAMNSPVGTASEKYRDIAPSLNGMQIDYVPAGDRDFGKLSHVSDSLSALG
jgi:hypothetical protein